MFFIGMVDYYATGEGCTIYVASGTEDSIREAIPDYFHPSLMILTPSAWVQAAVEPDDQQRQRYVEILKTSLPALWKQIEERASGRGPDVTFFFHHHYNYG